MHLGGQPLFVRDNGWPPKRIVCNPARYAIVKFNSLLAKFDFWHNRSLASFEFWHKHGYNTKVDQLTILQYTLDNTIIMAGLYCMHSHDP